MLAGKARFHRFSAWIRDRGVGGTGERGRGRRGEARNVKWYRVQKKGKEVSVTGGRVRATVNSRLCLCSVTESHSNCLCLVTDSHSKGR